MTDHRHLRPAAVLWDMDGTLVDTEPYWIAAERRLVAEYGRDWPDHHAHAMVGFDLRDSAAYMIEHGGIDDLSPEEIIDRLLDDVIASVRQRIPWRPGARELLAALVADGVPCGLVTMSWRRFVEPILDALPIGSFSVVVCGDDVDRGKPDPEPYRRAAQLLGVDPIDCMAIEDSPTGVASAVAAGCVTVGVPNVADLSDTRGATIVPSLVDVDLASIWESTHRPSPTRRRATLIALVAVAFALVGATLVLGGDDDAPGSAPGEIALDVWAPYWTLDDTLAQDDIESRVSVLREVSPFWFSVDGTGNVVVDSNTPTAEAERLTSLVAQSSARLVPSIIDHLPSGAMAALLADESRRTRHVERIIAFARETGADGIDIDYEQFAFADDPTTWPTTSPAWVAFIAELGDALRADGRTLTVSVPPVYDVATTGEIGYWVYAHGAIAEHVDAIRLMAYDFSTSSAGPVAPLDWTRDVVDGALKAVPVEHHRKLVLGIPAYGYNWVVATDGTCPADAPGRTGVTPASIDDLIARRGGSPVYDVIGGEWTFSYDLEISDAATSCVQRREVRWIDAEGVRERVHIARRAGLGGVSLWALGYEDPEVWASLVSSLSDEVPPETTVAP
jgi:HAD superfamily hydrolase (TIGR01509 family)